MSKYLQLKFWTIPNKFKQFVAWKVSFLHHFATNLDKEKNKQTPWDCFVTQNLQTPNLFDFVLNEFNPTFEVIWSGNEALQNTEFWNDWKTLAIVGFSE